MTPALRYIPCIAVTLLLGALPRVVYATDIQCPAQIQVSEQTDMSGTHEWLSFDSSPHGVHHFYAVAFSEGPPSERVYFNPREVAATATRKVEYYEFGNQLTGDLWISCMYRDSSLVVIKKIDPKPVSCRITYDLETGLRSVKTVHCD
jgi:hypothetical protein